MLAYAITGAASGFAVYKYGKSAAAAAGIGAAVSVALMIALGAVASKVLAGTRQ